MYIYTIIVARVSIILLIFYFSLSFKQTESLSIIFYVLSCFSSPSSVTKVWESFGSFGFFGGGQEVWAALLLHLQRDPLGSTSSSAISS